ncbi:MAG: tetratricopeptide repeat protein, partial [Chloroflexi bacterium]
MSHLNLVKLPLVGRASAFNQLIGSFQQAQQGQPQAVLVVGEAGIGKTRLVTEFVAWAQSQGAEVLSGYAIAMGGRLPYQLPVEALRQRMQAENAPENLVEDLWLAELARLLPELRVRYPDLPAPTQDELAAKVRLFEAVARLVDALAKRTSLVLLLEDLHWVDGASLDLLRYLGGYWKEHGSRVLLLGTMRSDQQEPRSQLSAELSDLGWDLPVTQITLQALSQAETIQLMQAIAGEGECGRRSGGEQCEHGLAGVVPAQEAERPLVGLGDFLARLAKLTQPARQLVRASAVLGNQATAKLLWQVAELGVQAGAEALKEAVRSGLLREEQAGGPGVGQLGRYRFSHEPMRDAVYSQLSAARRQVLHQRAFALLQAEGARASELAYHALFAGEAEAAYRASVQAGDEAVAVFAAEDAIGHYEQARALLQDQKPLQTALPASEVERLYTHLGRAFAFLNAWDKAQQAYEELVAYAQQQHLPTLGSMTLNRLAIVAVQQSKNRPQVQALLEEAWRMAQTSHDQLVLAETEWNLAQIHAVGWGDPTRAFPHGQQALEMARGIHHKELEARSLSLLGVMYTIGGDFEEATHCLEAALALYALLGNESTMSGALSLAHFSNGAPLTQPLTHRASEASCCATLAIAQVNGGQVLGSVRSGRRALALSKEIKNVWVELTSALGLTYGLLEAGAYEEALVLIQPTIALARTLPPTIV